MSYSCRYTLRGGSEVERDQRSRFLYRRPLSRDDDVLRHLDAVASGGLCHIQRLVSRAQ